MSSLEEFCWKLRRKYFPPEIKYGRNDSDMTLRARMANPIFLERYGFRVYSQFDEDGVIEEIFRRIGCGCKTFVEFGVQDGLESNAHFLLHKGWSGLWLEGNKKHCKKIKKLFAKPIAEERLEVRNTFVTAENINQIISEYLLSLARTRESNVSMGGGGGVTMTLQLYNDALDLLSIDIDGNDYHVWKAVKCAKARVVVIEYNSKFPPNFEWVMKYNARHSWDKDDNMGASLKSLELLGQELGYTLVGTNAAGSNAFFVRSDLVVNEAGKNLFPTPATSENLYNPPRWGVRYFSGQKSSKFIG